MAERLRRSHPAYRTAVATAMAGGLLLAVLLVLFALAYLLLAVP